MKLIRPIEIMSGDIVSSTAVESVAVYNPATTYNTEDTSASGDFIYESLVDSNTGNTPATSPTFWLLIGPTNKWAMFDSTVSTQTVGTSPLTVVVATNQIINSLALLNMSNVLSVDVEVRDTSVSPSEVVYTRTIDLDDSVVTDWYEYFFAGFELRGDVVLTDIPPFSTTEIEITLNSSGDSAIGVMQIGNSFDVGQTQLGVNLGIRDYSVKETDTFGNTIFVQRAFSKRMRPTVFAENSRLNSIFRVLSDVRAVPTVFAGTEEDGYESLILFGFLRDWNIEITYPENSLISLEVEGLI